MEEFFTILQAPSDLSLQVLSFDSIQLTWTDQSSDEDAFLIFRSDDGGTTYNVSSIAAANATSFTDTGLNPESTYSYYIRGIKGPFLSETTSALEGTTPAQPPPPALAPDTPSNLIAQAATYDTILLSWNDVGQTGTGDPETGYTLSYGTTTVDLPENTTAQIIDGLSASTTYDFSLTANNAVGTSSPALASATTPALPAVAPNAIPTGLAASQISTTTVQLTWSCTATNESGFHIYRNGTLVGSATADATLYNDASVTAGTTYNYMVAAYNNVAPETQSNLAYVTTATLPAAPSNYTVSLTTKLTAQWADNSSNESSFRIYAFEGLCSNTLIRPTLVKSVGANVTSTIIYGTDYTVERGHTYCSYVRAYNVAGYSSYSNKVQIAVP
jgi:titin